MIILPKSGWTLNLRLASGIGHLYRPCTIIDASLGRFLLARNAFDVDLKQHTHGVACPLGDLGGVARGIEPSGHSGVPKIVWSRSD
jgi:hypothetical protein